jgi:YbbR domain-containing protein
MSAAATLFRRITRHFGWKAASLLLAMLLWFAIEGAPELVTIQTVPILYRNLKSGLILTSDAPENVRAELRGSSVKLAQSALSEVSMALDLTDVTGPGERTYTLSSSNFTLPQGVSFLRVIPSQVRLVTDRIAVKDVPVKVRTEGVPPAGYALVSQDIAPSMLRISGPEARVKRIEFAETDLIDLRSLTQSNQVKVNAFLADGRVQFESAPVVTVTLTIERTNSH